MVREATKADFSTFMKLWIEFLEDQNEQGGEILLTPKTLSYFTLLFSAYVSGSRRGIVVLDDDRAVMMWGEDISDSMIETAHDPQARSWGVYVKPGFRGNGLVTSMYDFAITRLREMGFATMTSGVLMENKTGRASLSSQGFTFTHMGGYLRISAGGEEI